MSHEFLLAKYFYFFKSLRSICTSSKKLNRANGTPLEYFRLCGNFFRKKILTQGSPFNFLIFSDRMDIEKSQRVIPFSFFSIVRIYFFERVPNSPILRHFEALLLFLSLCNDKRWRLNRNVEWRN